MGRVNNGKVRKPGGAKALAREYRKNQPAGLGVWGKVTIGADKLLSSKKKARTGVGAPA